MDSFYRANQDQYEIFCSEVPLPTMTFLLHIALVINALYSTKHSTQRTATKKLVLQFFRFLPLARVNPPKMAKMINRSVFAGGQPPVHRYVTSAHIADLRLVRGHG
jgi:hypothetical protein